MQTVTRPDSKREAPSRTLTREMAAFAAYLWPALGRRVRITRTSEGWPEDRGRYGWIEWRGEESDGRVARLYIPTDARRMRARLLAVPGVHRWQIGDDEIAGEVAATDRRGIQAAAHLLRLRRRRAPARPVPAGFGVGPR